MILDVPGAKLYYEVAGRGPVLLVLQGGAAGAEGSAAIAPHLAAHYTVVSYDRRGLMRSPIDRDTAPHTLATHADDAHRLLAHVASEPAFVLGISIGARIGLELVTQHPDQIRLLVAHEPPVPELLPAERRVEVERDQLEIETAYRTHGAPAAMMRFVALAGVRFDDREADVVLARPGPERNHNMAAFLRHDAPAARQHALALDALATHAKAIVPAAGETNRAAWIYAATAALAARLERPLVEFPGGHSGYVLRPRAFAATLRTVLEGA